MPKDISYELVALEAQDPRDEIVDYCAKTEADLLVVGARGMGFLKRFMLGSTSDYCAHYAICPVAIYKTQSK